MQPLPAQLQLTNPAIWRYHVGEDQTETTNNFEACFILDCILNLFICLLTIFVNCLCCSDQFITMKSKTVTHCKNERFTCINTAALTQIDLQRVITYIDPADGNPGATAATQLQDVQRRRMPTLTLQSQFQVTRQIIKQTLPWTGWRVSVGQSILPRLESFI